MAEPRQILLQWSLAGAPGTEGSNCKWNGLLLQLQCWVSVALITVVTFVDYRWLPVALLLRWQCPSTMGSYVLYLDTNLCEPQFCCVRVQWAARGILALGWYPTCRLSANARWLVPNTTWREKGSVSVVPMRHQNSKRVLLTRFREQAAPQNVCVSSARCAQDWLHWYADGHWPQRGRALTQQHDPAWPSDRVPSG